MNIGIPKGFRTHEMSSFMRSGNNMMKSYSNITLAEMANNEVSGTWKEIERRKFKKIRKGKRR